MMAGEELTVRRIAELVGGTSEGDESVTIRGVASVEDAGAEDITFAGDGRWARRLLDSQAGAAIVAKEPKSAPMPLIRVDNVPRAVAELLGLFAGEEDLPEAGIHPGAHVAEDATLGEGVAVGPNAVIGLRATIGDRCVLSAGAVVGAGAKLGRDVVLLEGAVVRYGCVVGDRVRIGSNSVIGYDGFGYYHHDGVHHKIPHAGNVIIEDDVEIGACSCVDRAKFGSTRICAGAKIDNLVQVAHNVRIGPGCLLAGHAGVAGSTKLGAYVVMGGHSGVRDNVSVGSGVRIAAFTGVAADVPDGEAMAGIPALPARQEMRIMKAGKKLPDLLKRVKDLEARLKSVESSKDHP